MNNDNSTANANEVNVSEMKQRITRLGLDQRNEPSFAREIHSICRQLDTVSNPRTAIRLILAFFDVKCRPSCCPGKEPPSALYWSHVQKRFGNLIHACEITDREWIIDQLIEIIDRQNLSFVSIFEECSKFLPKEIMRGLGDALMKRYFCTEFAQSEHDVVVAVVVSYLGENLNDVDMFYAARRYGQKGKLELLDFVELLSLLGRSGDLNLGLKTAEAIVNQFAVENPASVMFLAIAINDEHPLLSMFVRQKLVDHLLQVGTKQALENAANQLVTMDQDAPKVRDWFTVEPHAQYVDRLRREHADSNIFWNSYTGGMNRNIEGYTLNVYI